MIVRALFCGQRTYANHSAIEAALAQLPVGSTIIHGAARGADRIAGELARRLGFHVEAYPADWNRYGRSAGPIRNQEMLDTGVDVVMAFFTGDGLSVGTVDMVRRASAAGVKVMEVVDCPGST